MRCASLVCVLLLLLAALTTQGATPTATPVTVISVNEVAEAYVKLVLAMGQHDSDYVDAYYGPQEWKNASETKKPLDAIALEATQLRDQLAKISMPADEMERLRRAYLTKQLSALQARVRILKGEHLKFDEESQALYDAVAPKFSDSHFQGITFTTRCLRKISSGIAAGLSSRCIRCSHPNHSLPKARRTSAERLYLRNRSGWRSKRKCSGRPRGSTHYVRGNSMPCRAW